MLSTWLIILNHPVVLSHQHSTTVSLETYPFRHNLSAVYPMTLKSDLHLNSPYIIIPQSKIKVTRIMRMIIN